MASLTSWLAMANAEIEISTHREIDDASNNAGRDGEEKLDRLTRALARPAAASVGHGADFFFHFGRIHHDDGVPGAAIEEATVRALAQALLAPDAENRIDLNASEWRMVLVWNPKHAIFDGAVFDAGGRAGATGTAFGDHGKFFGLLFARGGNAF